MLESVRYEQYIILRIDDLCANSMHKASQMAVSMVEIAPNSIYFLVLFLFFSSMRLLFQSKKIKLSAYQLWMMVMINHENSHTNGSHREDLLSLVGHIVSAYVANNQVQADTLPNLIQQVYKSLSIPAEPEPVVAERPQPAVPIKKSVHDDYIICLEDGAQLKMLKRYLQTRYNMTPEQYRERWGLSPDYPMVAPSYAERRSSLAKSIGLGRKKVEAIDTSAKRGRR